MSKSQRRQRRRIELQRLRPRPTTMTTLSIAANWKSRPKRAASARNGNAITHSAMRERDELRRKMFTTYLLWTICPHKACQRAKACVGDDTEECRRERWRVAVPDEVRAELAKICELVSEGHSMDETCRLAHEDMMMREKLMAKLEALHPRREPEENDTLADFTTRRRLLRPSPRRRRKKPSRPRPRAARASGESDARQRYRLCHARA